MEQKKSRAAEVIRFLIAGGVCFLIEQGFFTLLNQMLGLGSIPAKAIAFFISTMINYLLCMYWVFKGKKDSGNIARIGFLVTSGIGLLLNLVLMLLFAALWGENTVICSVSGRTITIAVLNSCIATVIVMVWNYFTKRAILTSGWLTDLVGRISGESEKEQKPEK